VTTAAPPPGGASDGTAPFDFRAVFRVALVLIPLGVLGNLAFSFLATDRAILQALDEFPRQWLAVALGLTLLPWLTRPLRLLIWTRFLGYRIGFLEAFQMVLAVDLGASVSPTAVGGGFLQWGLLVDRGVSGGTAASITALPTIEDAVFFAIALPTAVVLTAAWEVGTWTHVAGTAATRALVLVALAAAIFLVVLLLARAIMEGFLGVRTRRWTLRSLARVRRGLRSAWADARDVFALIRDHGKARFALSLTLTAIQWSARYSVITALVAFLGAPVKPVLFWGLQWIVFTLMSLMPTPGAAGGAEVTFALVYGSLLPAGIVGVATAGWRFLTFYLQVGTAALLFPLLARLTPSGPIPRLHPPDSPAGDA
jgi:uncharacterized protein (TIRG00374 family)